MTTRNGFPRNEAFGTAFGGIFDSTSQRLSGRIEDLFKCGERYYDEQFPDSCSDHGLYDSDITCCFCDIYHDSYSGFCACNMEIPQYTDNDIPDVRQTSDWTPNARDLKTMQKNEEYNSGLEHSLVGKYNLPADFFCSKPLSHETLPAKSQSIPEVEVQSVDSNQDVEPFASPPDLLSVPAFVGESNSCVVIKHDFTVTASDECDVMDKQISSINVAPSNCDIYYDDDEIFHRLECVKALLSTSVWALNDVIPFTIAYIHLMIDSVLQYHVYLTREFKVDPEIKRVWLTTSLSESAY